MNSLRIVHALCLLTVVCGVSVGRAANKITNWRFQSVTEIEQPLRSDSLIESKEPSLKKASERADTLCSRIKKRLAEQVPATFFSNPPYAGEIVATVVLKQKVSFRLPSSSNATRAAEVSEAIGKTGRFPAGDDETRRRKEVEEIKGKAKDYVDVGIRIIMKDAAGSEVLTAWYPAGNSGKVNIKKCAREIAHMLRLVAARPEPLDILEKR